MEREMKIGGSIQVGASSLNRTRPKDLGATFNRQTTAKIPACHVQGPFTWVHWSLKFAKPYGLKIDRPYDDPQSA